MKYRQSQSIHRLPDLTEYVWGVLFDEAFTINSFSDSFYLIEYSPFERWLYKQQWIDTLKNI